MILGRWELVLILTVILMLSGARTLPEAVNRRNDARKIMLSCVTSFLAIFALILILQFFQ